MSSRYDDRRRDYGRDDRDRDRGGRHGGAPPRRDARSRSRSPRRGGGDRGRRISDRRDYRDDRRDRDRDSHRDDRRRDDRDRRDPPRDARKDPRDHDRDRRDPPRKDERDGDHTSDRPHESTSRAHEKRPEPEVDIRHSYPPPGASEEPTSREDSEALVEDGEEGETMEATNDDDAAMMAMMGLTGFGTTKGKHVEGNQGGSTDVKKMRTWRQYMNRRGGFNRPLDKIK